MQSVPLSAAAEEREVVLPPYDEQDDKDDDKEDEPATGQNERVNRHDTPLVDINDLLHARAARPSGSQLQAEGVNGGTGSGRSSTREEWISGLLSRFKRAPRHPRDRINGGGSGMGTTGTQSGSSDLAHSSQADATIVESTPAQLLADVHAMLSRAQSEGEDAVPVAGAPTGPVNELSPVAMPDSQTIRVRPRRLPCLHQSDAPAPQSATLLGSSSSQRSAFPMVPITDKDIDPALLVSDNHFPIDSSMTAGPSTNLRTGNVTAMREGHRSNGASTELDSEGVPLDPEARRLWWLRGGENPRPAHFAFDAEGRRVDDAGREVDANGIVVDVSSKEQPLKHKRRSRKAIDLPVRTVLAPLDETAFSPATRKWRRSGSDQDRLTAYRATQARPWRWPRHPDNIIFDPESEEANERAQLDIEQTIALYAKRVTRKWATTGVPELAKRPWTWEGEVAPLRPLPQGDERPLESRLDSLEESVLDLLQRRRRHGEEEIAYLKRVEDLLRAEEALSDEALEAILRHGETDGSHAMGESAPAPEASGSGTRAEAGTPDRRATEGEPQPNGDGGAVEPSAQLSNGHLEAPPGETELLSQRHGKPQLTQESPHAQRLLASQANGKPIPPSQAKPNMPPTPQSSHPGADRSATAPQVDTDAESEKDDEPLTDESEHEPEPDAFDYDFLFYTLLSDSVDDIELQDRIVDAFHGMAPSSRFDFTRPADQDLYLQAPCDYLPREQCQALMAMVESSINKVLMTLLAARVRGIRSVRQGKPARGWGSVFAAAALVLPKDIVLAAEAKHREQFAAYPSGRSNPNEVAERLQLVDDTIGANKYRLCGDQLKDQVYEVLSDSGSGSEEAVEGEIEVISVPDSDDEQDAPRSEQAAAGSNGVEDPLEAAIRRRARKNAKAEKARERAAAARTKSAEVALKGLKVWRQYQARQAEREASARASVETQTTVAAVEGQAEDELDPQVLPSRKRKLVPEVVLDSPRKRDRAEQWGTVAAHGASESSTSPNLLRPTWKTTSSPVVPGRRTLPRTVSPSPLAGPSGQSASSASPRVTDGLRQPTVTESRPPVPPRQAIPNGHGARTSNASPVFAIQDALAQAAVYGLPQPTQPPLPKRKRGRPSNAERAARLAAAAAAAAEGAVDAPPLPPPPKRKRGRPSNAELAAIAAAVEQRRQSLTAVPFRPASPEVDELMSSPAPERVELEQKPRPSQLVGVVLPSPAARGGGASSVAVMRRRPGRPRKNPLPVDPTSVDGAPTITGSALAWVNGAPVAPRRGPGRPRKSALPTAPATAHPLSRASGVTPSM